MGDRLGIRNAVDILLSSYIVCSQTLRISSLLRIGQKKQIKLHLGNKLTVWILHCKLSKRHKQLKLDSLLQEVCINIKQLTYNCSFFRAKESLLSSIYPSVNYLSDLLWITGLDFMIFDKPNLLCIWTHDRIWLIYNVQTGSMLMSTAISCWKHQFSSDHWS